MWYLQKTIKSIDRFIEELRNNTIEKGVIFAKRYFLHKGLKQFRQEGNDARTKEINQHYRQACFEPISIKYLAPQQKRRTQEAILVQEQKSTKKIKGRIVFNEKPTGEQLSREDTSSPTASLQTIFKLETTDEYEERDIIFLDVPNAFIQTNTIPKKDGKKRVSMIITGMIVEILLELGSDTYSNNVVFENGGKVIYVVVLRSIYGMIVE